MHVVDRKKRLNNYCFYPYPMHVHVGICVDILDAISYTSSMLAQISLCACMASTEIKLLNNYCIYINVMHVDVGSCVGIPDV